MKEKVASFLKEQKISPQDTLLVAVSGGKDSVTLLDVLVLLWQEQTIQNHQVASPPFRLAVAHYNHQSRGEENQKDQQFVADLVATYEKEMDSFLKSGHTKGKWNLPFWEGELCPFFLGTSNVPQHTQERKGGFEETARQLRYGFLEETANTLDKMSLEKQGKTYILTAHHGKDNVETLLLHLARGTGLQGLGGIPPRRGNILRPMLSVLPEEIDHWVGESGLAYRQDNSNFDRVYRRNYVRWEILDKLQVLNQRYLEHSMNTMSIIQEENKFLQDYVAERLSFQYVDCGVVCSVAQWQQLPSSLQQRGLQQLAQKKGCTLKQQQLCHILKMLQGGKPYALFSLGEGLQIRRSYDTLTIEPVGKECHVSTQEVGLSPSPFPQTLHWNGWHVTVTWCCYNSENLPSVSEEGTPNSYRERWHLWVANVTDLQLRTRQTGDRLRLAKRPEKTVKKWCIDEKIPKNNRDTLPVFVKSSSSVVAVALLGTQVGYHPNEGQYGFFIEGKREKSE